MYIYVYISKNKKPRFIGFIDNAAVVSPQKTSRFGSPPMVHHSCHLRGSQKFGGPVMPTHVFGSLRSTPFVSS